MTDETIFAAAVERPTPADRAEYLHHACADDPDRRARVEALLAAHDRVGEFLERPAFDPEAGTTRTFGGPPRAAADADVLALLAPAGKPGSLGRLRHYEVLEVLGRGGFGTVLRAFDEKLHRVVAIKVLAPRLAASGSARQRFTREARAAAAVRHENVVDIHAVDDDGPVPFLVMEYVAGKTLQDKLDATGPLPVEEVLRIAAQAAAGLAAAHRQGKVHRDVKPGNILLEDGVERVKLADFGLARAVDDASITQSGVIAGTPLYMSPEQARGAPVDTRSDLFSLGSVLYAMCTGRPPFRAGSSAGVLKRVTEDTPRSVLEVNSRVPAWLARVVEKLLAKDPADRFATAAEVAELLTTCLAELQLKGGVTPRGAAPAGRRVRRWAALGVCVLAGGIAAYAFTRPDSPAGPGAGSAASGKTEPPAAVGGPVPPEPLLATRPVGADEVRDRQEAWARHLGLDAVEFTTAGVSLRVIPPGEFLMGSTGEEVESLVASLKPNNETRLLVERAFASETPQHRVRITRPFAIGKAEVTVLQFRKFVEGSKDYTTRPEADRGGFGFRDGEFVRVRNPEFSWQNVGYVQPDLAPVWNVTTEDAAAFCRWLGEQDRGGRTYRLPTEAEWEYACRAGTTTRTFWGGQRPADSMKYAWGPAGSPEGRPKAVEGRWPNAFGLHDMCGNVWEWCSDWYAEDYYRQSPMDDPRGPEKPTTLPPRRVLRGGSVERPANLHAFCSTYRSVVENKMTGFRVVCELGGR